MRMIKNESQTLQYNNNMNYYKQIYIRYQCVKDLGDFTFNSMYIDNCQCSLFILKFYLFKL